MYNLKYLELKKLISELEYLESDYEFHSELLKVNNVKFFEHVETFLDKYPQLKEMYNSNQKIINESSSTDVEKLNTKEEKSSHLKSLYREVVKNTHPDKIESKKMNEYYLEATSAYQDGNISKIYKVCLDLNINFQIEEKYITEIISEINKKKESIDFIKKDFTFIYALEEDSKKKDKLVFEFIKKQVVT